MEEGGCGGGAYGHGNARACERMWETGLIAGSASGCTLAPHFHAGLKSGWGVNCGRVERGGGGGLLEARFSPCKSEDVLWSGLGKEGDGERDGEGFPFEGGDEGEGVGGSAAGFLGGAAGGAEGGLFCASRVAVGEGEVEGAVGGGALL